jgi:hypothetical protein
MSARLMIAWALAAVVAGAAAMSPLHSFLLWLAGTACAVTLTRMYLRQPDAGGSAA